jgi:hypothetical protein
VESGERTCCDDLFSTGGGRNIRAVTRAKHAIKLLQERYKMERLGLRLMPAILALALAAPVAAQNGSASQGTTTTITSNPSRAEPTTPAAPPATPPTNTAPATTPVPVTVEPAQPVVVAPPVQVAPQQPIAIQPDVAYPNGFADPNDPFANDTALANRNRQGFPWGLLGLLGLLGLIPLFRKSGRISRTVYVDRDDPKRVLREEQVEE